MEAIKVEDEGFVDFKEESSPKHRQNIPFKDEKFSEDMDNSMQFIPLSGRSEQEILDIEAEDIRNAIAASLDTPQVVAEFVHSNNWKPVTEQQKQTRERQDEALKDASSLKDYPGFYKAIGKSLDDVKSKKKVHEAEISSGSGEDTKCAQPFHNHEPSLKRRRRQATASNEVSTLTATQPRKISEPLTNIDDCIKDLIGTKTQNMDLEVATGCEPFSDPEGNVYVFIDPPNIQPGQNEETYELYRNRFESPIVMKSSILMPLGSSFLDNALSATAQYRVTRRRGLQGKKPPHIKYVLDMTPSVEGDDAAHLLSEISCSEGIRKWSIASKLWIISSTLVSGQDEYISKDATGYELDQAAYDKIASVSNRDEREQRFRKYFEASTLGLPLEYSPIAHRSAIVRVLRVSSGLDPGINSAAKVWTMCVVANHHELVTPPLVDHVVSWIYNGQNSLFLEILAEASLKIGDMLKCNMICRDAFAILVGEEALQSLCRLRVPNPPFTVHGRRKEDLVPDEFKTRIEYASKAFIDRVMGEFRRLLDMKWVEDLPEYKRLDDSVPMNVINIDQYDVFVREVQLEFKAYIRGSIFRVLCVDWRIDEKNLREWDYYRTNSLFSSKDVRVVWNDLLPEERLFTRLFWSLFIHGPLAYGPTNLSTAPLKEKVGDRKPPVEFVPDNIPSVAQEKLREEGHFRKVAMDDLMKLASTLEQLRVAPPTDESMGDLSSAASAIIEGAPKPDSLLTGLTIYPYTQAALVQASKAPRGPKPFNLHQLFKQAMSYLSSVATYMLSKSHGNEHDIEVLETLNCLEEAELKYLPLWAGGCDDGSGGVYDDDIPMATASFSHPGPNVHIGPDSFAGSSEFDFVGGPSNASTTTNVDSNTKASTDVASMFGAVVINSTNSSEVASMLGDVAIKSNTSGGNSEYDFASATSIVGDPAHQQAAGPSEEAEEKPMSAKAFGKRALQPDDDPEVVAAALDKLEREQRARAKKEDDEDQFMFTGYDSENDANSDETFGDTDDDDGELV